MSQYKWHLTTHNARHQLNFKKFQYTWLKTLWLSLAVPVGAKSAKGIYTISEPSIKFTQHKTHVSSFISYHHNCHEPSTMHSLNYWCRGICGRQQFVFHIFYHKTCGIVCSLSLTCNVLHARSRLLPTSARGLRVFTNYGRTPAEHWDIVAE